MENSELDQPFSPVDILQNERRSTRANVIMSLEDDPENAARAQTLAENTGAHPALVHSDVEGFEAQYKTSLVSKLLNDNKYLAEYANSHPLAAKISNDDWGNLDAFSETLQKFTGPGGWIAKALIDSRHEILDIAKEGLKVIAENPPDTELGAQTEQYLLDQQYQQNQPLNQAQARQTRQTIEGRTQRANVELLSGPMQLLLSPMLGLFRHYISEPIEEYTGFPKEAVEGYTMAVGAVLGLKAKPEAAAKLHETAVAIDPYIRSGKKPPYGLTELVDKALEEESTQGLKSLDEALKAAVKTNTRERSAEFLRQFTALHGEDTNIGISADAVRKLYGDKPPLADDNLLGFVPRLAEQLQLAEMGGGDVQVPLADWLAKVDPALAKELHDDIRVRPGGVTKNEVKEAAEVRKVKADLIEEPATKAEGEEVVPADPTDQAVVATRKAAALDTTLDKIADKAFNDLHGKLQRGYEYTRGGVYVRIVPKEQLLAKEKEIHKAMLALRDRIAGKSVGLKIADYVGLSKDRESQGLYQSFDKIAPIIFYSTKASNIPDTVRHEVIHFLRDYNFLSKKEWSILEREAEAKGWVEKHQVDKQYADLGLDKADLLEEAIAKEYGEWGSTTAKAAELTEKYSKEAGATFQKIKDILAQIKDAIKEIFGHSPDVAELFENIESGKVKDRGPGEPNAGTKDIRPKANQFELPQAGTTRMAERELFTKASAIGMTVDQYKRYMKLIEKRRTEDQTAIAEIALREERKHQTQEWKDNSAIIRGEVATDINQRPDIAADEFLRAGEHKLSPEGLTDEQVAALPKKLVGPNGVRADDIAGFFGYTTGSQLVDRLVQLNAARDAAGMKPEAYRRRIIEAETERRMQAKYGDLDRNIIEEAKEHVLSETQMDLLHEETLALGMKNGLELSFTKEDVRKGIQKEFDNTILRNVDSDASLAAAGRAGRAAEMHHLKEEWGDAFKYKQQQYFAIQTARLAKSLEKAREQFDKTAKRFSAREVPQVEQEYTNFIHDILMRTGQRVKRSVQDLADSLARGEQKTLEDFVDYKQGHDMREVPVAEFLLDGGFRKNLEDLTAKEFNDLHDSIKTLVKNGRDEKKINKAGEEADLAEVKAKMIEQLQEFKERHYDAEGKRWLGPIPPVVARPMRTFLASVLQIESIFNRWDRGDPRGVFTQYVSRELSVAANFEASLERKYSRLLGDIADKTDLKAKIANDLFNDPFSRTDTDPGVPIQMTRKNLRAILLNAGNASNLDKLARGYHVKPEQVLQWLHQTATKEDWDWAQKMGNIFAEIKKEADTMYRGLSGIEPENIPVEPITTPHGEYPGWYYPVIYHPVWEGKSKKLMGGDALEQENYVRATTPRGYTKSRTGYAAPLDLSLDQAPVRMKQMIHDIAFRPAVINASKIFYDQQIRQAVTKHYGVEYSKLLVPYLRDVANSANFRSDAASVGANVSEFIRQNIIATLIGLNPGTVMKHGPTAAINSLTEVGPANFAKAVKGLFSVNDATGETNWTFAMTTSEELGRRHRHWNETLGGATQKIQDESSIRNMVMKFGAYPVAMSDLLSAVPTWLAKYEAEMRLGTDHGESVFLADRAVRRAHGSSVVTNRPALMRGGPLASWLTSLYGFFNHILNRQYELMWKAGDTVDLVKAGEWKAAAKNSPELMAGLFSYILFPALVEEMVTPLTNDKKESAGSIAAKAIAYTLGSSWPVIRDVVAAALHGRDPSAGLLSTAGKTITDVARDISKGNVAFNKAHAGQLIQHGVTMFGGLTGLANAQIGKSGRFIYDYSTGQARPKGFGDWWKGLRKGTLKETH